MSAGLVANSVDGFLLRSMQTFIVLAMGGVVLKVSQSPVTQSSCESPFACFSRLRRPRGTNARFGIRSFGIFSGLLTSLLTSIYFSFSTFVYPLYGS